jgi:tetraacyldisaccharide 4'-kinase
VNLRLVAPGPPRSPWQLFYGAAHRLRRSWYRKRARSLDRPVVSVGNLHWGGGGKTPLVAALAGHLRDRGEQVAILSRGYGGKGKGIRLVSHGQGPLLGPLIAGDEPVQLAGDLPGVAVVVGPDRWAAGKEALERLSPRPTLFLLDDGFSHLALRRDIDLLALPWTDPFAGGRLLPAGRLREPLSSSSRADAALLTGAPDEPNLGDELAATLRVHGFRGPAFAARVETEAPVLANGTKLPAGSQVLAVSGIARPEPFENSLRAAGFEVAEHLVFADHHAYPDSSFERIRRAWRDGYAAVLTTAKDRVKIAGKLDLPLAELPLRSRPEPAFWEWFDGRVNAFSR